MDLYVSTTIPSLHAREVIDSEEIYSKIFETKTQDPTPSRGLFQRAAKRVFDVILALSIAIIFLPVLVAISVAIFCRDRGPIVFRHTRVGENGKEFSCLKFRTMVLGAEEKLQHVLQSCPKKQFEWDTTQKLTDDPRIISGVGEFLRKSSLDELPQLLNVLRGEMSLIGPRPVTEGELCRYGCMVKYYLSVKPGLTGPWQIGGRSELSFDDRVNLDIDYAMNGTLMTDCKLFAKTVWSFLTGRLSGAT